MPSLHLNLSFMMIWQQYIEIFLIGIGVGFLGGLFGKGGSAIATPLLSLVGVPGFVAVAAPLPATIPGTFIASLKYRKSNYLDNTVVLWSVLIGIPATIIGSYLTKYTGALPLLILTGILVLVFGISFIVSPKKSGDDNQPTSIIIRPSYWKLRLTLIASFVGLVSGLLANSGGFLLAPSFAKILKLPIKNAFACSLAVSMFLAIPGTIVHVYLGHIDWIITLVLATGSIPFSYIGAGVAIKTKSAKLALMYGIILTILGIFFLIKLFIPSASLI